MRIARHFLLAGMLLGAAALPFAAAPAPAGDAAVARTLLETGKKAVHGRKYEEGVAILRKALQEDPDLSEAAYWIAVARERDKDDAGALAGYREFLGILDRRGSPTAEEQRLRALAEKRLDALAAGEKELKKVEDRYVDDLLAFARDRLAKDPAAALRALDRVFEVRPAYPAAASLHEKITGKPYGGGDPGAPGPFARVAAWTDMIRERTILDDRNISYAGELMVVDIKGGSRLGPDRPVDVGTAFAYETEFRVTETYETGWCAGISFAENGDEWVSAFLRGAQLIVSRASKREPGHTDLANRAVPATDRDTWHRLGVVVRGSSWELWYDGKKVAEDRVQYRPDLGGEIGIWQQGCRAERRILRAGRL